MKNVKKSLKPIPPTLRGKKRYVLFELACDKKLSSPRVSDALWKTFLRIYGEFGAGEMKLWMIEFGNGKGIIRCAHNRVEQAKAGILFLTEVDGVPVIPKTLKTSGSLKKIRTWL